MKNSAGEVSPGCTIVQDIDPEAKVIRGTGPKNKPVDEDVVTKAKGDPSSDPDTIWGSLTVPLWFPAPIVTLPIMRSVAVSAFNIRFPLASNT
jgi:hypothetical protein